MKRPSRETFLIIGILVLVFGMTSLAAILQGNEEAVLPPLASFSSQPNGGRALLLWLEELGYQADGQIITSFQIPAGADLVLILEPQNLITDQEWEVLDEWVAQGGVLALIGQDWATILALEHYHFGLTYLANDRTFEVAVASPILLSPPLQGVSNGMGGAFLVGEGNDYVTHLTLDDRPAMVSFAQGSGRVILSTLVYPLSNVGLKEALNPDLALNLASLAGSRPGTIWFNEWHHGQRGQNASEMTLEKWLRTNPAGQALLYTLGVIFIAAVLRGQIFGRPLPLPESGRRRAPLEHITAIANLKRRAGHRPAVFAQYYRHLKRTLGKRYRLSPDLPDDQYVAQLAQYNPQIDQVALRQLLERLRSGRGNDTDLIQLAKETADWLKSYE